MNPVSITTIVYVGLLGVVALVILLSILKEISRQEALREEIALLRSKWSYLPSAAPPVESNVPVERSTVDSTVQDSPLPFVGSVGLLRRLRTSFAGSVQRLRLLLKGR